MKRTFTNELQDPTSSDFQQLASLVVSNILSVVKKSTTGVADIQIVGFTRGSVIAIYKIIMDDKNEEEKENDQVQKIKITDAITTAVRNGTLNSLDVDPSYPITVANG